MAQNKLARLYFDADRQAEAIQLYERVRDAQMKSLGPDHPIPLPHSRIWRCLIDMPTGQTRRSNCSSAFATSWCERWGPIILDPHGAIHLANAYQKAMRLDEGSSYLSKFAIS